MKKVLFFAAAMFAAVSLNAESVVIYQEGMVPEKSHKDADNNTIIDQEGTVIAEANELTEVWSTNNLKVSVLDGAKQWILKSGVGDDGVETFTAQDGNTYSKHYAQGGTNGMTGHLTHSTGTSAHLEIVPAVAGKLYVAAKFGKNKPIWAAKVPQQVIEDEELNLSNLVEYLVEGYSTAELGADGAVAMVTAVYPKEDGSGVQETEASADVYAALPLDVEPGYTYFFWVSGSKLMLCGLSFEASEEPVATVPEMQLHGSWVEKWGGPKMDIAADNATASATVNLAAGNYEFGVKELDAAGEQAAWWSTTAGDTFTREANSVVLVKGGSKNANLTADVAGDYKFVFTYATSTLAVEFPAAEGIFNATETVKATKVIENGQVVIIRGDVRYNALGTVIE